MYIECKQRDVTVLSCHLKLRLKVSFNYLSCTFPVSGLYNNNKNVSEMFLDLIAAGVRKLENKPLS